MLADHEILAARPPKNAVDPWRPYAFFVERERTVVGSIDVVATIFLTNRECPYRCLMCDLWRNTTDETVPLGAIPAQIDFALAQLPAARHVKLYNSGNFFDAKAVPPQDYAAIAERVRYCETVIVENHPKLCTAACVHFRDLVGTNLEIAIGLETVHPQVLLALNKQMTTGDFERAVRFLTQHNIATRAFILIKPPFLTEIEGVDWAIRSMTFAFDCGVECCSLIPTRAGNGIMDVLQARGDFAPPTLSSLEETLAAGIDMQRGRVFLDLWDIERFYDCPHCGPARRDRLQQMNWEQTILPPVPCEQHRNHKDTKDTK